MFAQNRGACVALNDAITRAAGEYIAVLNSDDLFLPGKLAAQVAFLDARPDVLAVFGQVEFIGEDGGPLAGKHFASGQLRKGNQSRFAWLREFFFTGNALAHPTAMIRRHVYRDVGAYDPCFAQLPDFDMWIRLCRRGEIEVLPQALSAYRIRDGQLNASAVKPETRSRHAWEHRRILDRFRGLDRATLIAVFPELRDADPSLDPDWHVAQLAYRVGSPTHMAFALDTMYEVASKAGDAALCRQVIALTGSYDIYGILGGPQRKTTASPVPRVVFETPPIRFRAK